MKYRIRWENRNFDDMGTLSTHVFETRTATGSELFSLFTCPHTTAFTLPSIFSLLEMSSIKRLGDNNFLFRLPFASQNRAYLRGEKLNYNSCTNPLLRKSQNLLFWLLKSSGHQSLPCLFDSRFF